MEDLINKDILNIEWYFGMGLRPIPLYHPFEGCQCSLKQTSNQCFDEYRGYYQCIGKVPRHRDWAERSYSIDDFKGYCNVALAMGRQPNNKWLLGLDIDGELDFPFYYDMPKTLTIKSGRGIHYIFQVDNNAPFGNYIDILSTRDKEKGYKDGYNGSLDMRYARGALVAPPSLHGSGHYYKFIHKKAPAYMPWDFQRFFRNALIKKYPKIKSYYSWTSMPTHKGKKP